MSTILAIDYGEKRVGLAIGDTETKLALPYGVLVGLSDEQLAQHLAKVVAQEGVGKIIVGEPISMSGKESIQTQVTRNFAGFLAERLAVPIELVDERLTSRQAEAMIFSAALPTRSRDELAAMFLLQAYLERHKLAGE